MAAWRKKFDKWKNASAPVEVSQVEPLLQRVFGERFRRGQGTSHQWHIDVSEIVGEPGFTLPNLPIVVRGGQKVIPVYLQNAYRAAELLGLYPPEDEENNDTDEQDD